MGEIEDWPKMENGNFLRKSAFSTRAVFCIVLRLITGFKAPMDSAVTSAKNGLWKFWYLLPKGRKQFLRESTRILDASLFWRQRASQQVRVKDALQQIFSKLRWNAFQKAKNMLVQMTHVDRTQSNGFLTNLYKTWIEILILLIFYWSPGSSSTVGLQAGCLCL